MALKIGKTDVTKLLREEAKNLGNGFISLLRVPAEKSVDVAVEALTIMINESGYECVYITLGKPFGELNKFFRSKGIDIGKLYFIDAISQMYGAPRESTKKCTYVSGPIDIDSITSALNDLLLSLSSAKKCVFLDSVTTVLLYNSLPRTVRFSKFLTRSVRDMGVDAVMVSVARGATTERLIKELSKLCDEFIDIA